MGAPAQVGSRTAIRNEEETDSNSPHPIGTLVATQLPCVTAPTHPKLEGPIPPPQALQSLEPIHLQEVALRMSPHSFMTNLEVRLCYSKGKTKNERLANLSG